MNNPQADLSPTPPPVSATQTDGPPLVSVIMPCFNTAHFVAEAIESVLIQDYPHVELIVVDDGSSDDTLTVVEQYQHHLTLIRQDNRGPAAARNAGIRAAQGAYLTFLDSDDVWLPGKLSSQVDYLEEHPETDLVHGELFRWTADSDGHFHRPQVPYAHPGPPRCLPDESGWIYHRLFFDPVLSTITAMLRRPLLDRIGWFDESLKRGEDYDLWFRASRVTPVHKLDHPDALYRLHNTGSATIWPEENYELQVLLKALDRWGPQGPDGSRPDPSALRRRIHRLHFNFGHFHYHRGTPAIAARSFLRAALRAPWRPKTWAYLALSLGRASGLGERSRKADHA